MSTTIQNIDSESVLTIIRVRSNECVDLHRKINKDIKAFMKKCSVLGESGLEQLGHKEKEGLIYEKFQLIQSSISNTIFKFKSFNSTFLEVKAEEVFKEHFIFNIKKLINLEESLKRLEKKVSKYSPIVINIINASDSDKEHNKILHDEILSDLNDINSLMIGSFDGITNVTNIISNEINDRIIKFKSAENTTFENRFREQTEVIIKGYEHEIQNLTESFKNQLQNLRIDQEAAVKSNELLNKNSDMGLKKLAELNEKTQNIELEYSKIIKTESDKIQREIEVTKDYLTNNINISFKEVNDQINAIKTTHSDLLGLVEKAGIYELTKNYKEKSDEEKIEYKEYRNYTSLSIIAAIASTIAVFAFAFWEQSQLPAGKVVDTNYLLLVSRLSISLMFFVLALYLSKQASKHYECYQENHRTFLQLAALEPFMARMTPEEQKEIRKGLIPSYFNQANEGKYASKGDEVDLSSNMTAIVNSLIEKIPSKKESESSNKPEGTVG